MVYLLGMAEEMSSWAWQNVVNYLYSQADWNPIAMGKLVACNPIAGTPNEKTVTRKILLFTTNH